MSNQNIDKEVLVSIYKNARIAIQSISDVIDETAEKNLREELSEEYEAYEKFLSKLSEYMKKTGAEVKDVNPFKKAMLFASVKMNSFADNSNNKIAEMTIKGTVNGITELREILNSSTKDLSPQTLDLVKELLTIEENNEERLKNFL